MHDLKTKLEADRLEATWNALQPHAERDALVLVSRELNLVDVGVALAQDQTAVVEGWIGQGLLVKPSSDHIKAWEQEQSKLFWMLIVQPFVLIQELSPPEQQALRQRAVSC